MNQIDRDVISLWCFVNLDDVQMVEEVHGPPNRRSGRASHPYEIRNRKLGIVCIDEQSEDVVGSTDTKHLGIAARLYADASSYALLHEFG